MLKIKSKVWLEEGGATVFGTGRAAVLKAVAQTGSLNQAAVKLGISYRKIWSIIHTAEERLGYCLLHKQQGGKSGGGATLTDSGQELLDKFIQLDKDVRVFTDKRRKEIF